MRAFAEEERDSGDREDGRARGRPAANAAAEGSERRAQRLPRNPRRHRRRRVGAVRRRSFRMYTRYAERNRWAVEIVSASSSELGGYKEVIVRIAGQGAYSKLKFESGGHRVQRVPETEAQGRIHTSACTVAVLPEADAIADITINPADVAHRHVPRVRRRRPARQQDRLGGAHHAPADRYRRRVPGRSLAAPQPRAGDGGARVAPARQGADGATGEGSGASQEPDRLGRPQRAHPHLQFPAGPGHRPPDQPDALHDRRDHGWRSRRALDRARAGASGGAACASLGTSR